MGEHGTPEQPALSELHAQGLQRLLLALGLDALGDHPGSDVAAEGQQRNHEGAAGAVGVDGGDQGAIDLDEFGAQLRDHSHARVPCAGVVDGDPEPAGPQLRRDALQQCQVGNRLPLTELEDHRSRIHPRVEDRLVERGDTALVDQGADEHVDEEIGLADVRCGLQGGTHACQVDRRLHVQSRRRTEELVRGMDASPGWETGERLVADDGVVHQTDDRLQRSDDPTARDHR